MADSLVCERIHQTGHGTNPYLIVELKTGCGVPGDYQFIRG